MSETLHFERPWLLLFALVPLIVSPAALWFERRQRQRWQALGDASQLRQHVNGTAATSLMHRILLSFSWLSLCIALAGPRWGRGEESGIAVGRDIVIALDFSRSMWAEDVAPSRWQASVQAAKDLVAVCKARGGDRIGIVIFAAQPLVIAPLTTDYDHLLQRLDLLDARTPPAEIRPASDAAVSGTRIGAALKAAVELHDPRFPGFQEIVLVTDADDPAADEEWKQGVDAARLAKIPVHVIGVGDAERDVFILKKGEPLEGPEGQIQSRLREEIARAIAVETRSEYLAARTEVPKMREFYRSAIQSDASREVSDERRPQPRDRASWFYLAAALGLSVVWCGARFQRAGLWDRMRA